MHAESNANGMSTGALARRASLLVLAAVAAGFAGRGIGFTPSQAVAASVFLSTILGTLLFWNLRLSIAFLGVAVLILTRSLDLPTLVEATSLP
ncbi:MAG: hypothetical protein GX548_11735, partial [Lentisphaerae bacterium]|nr:hypothetical protein [Lentisphaerota bacterium]